MVGYDWSQFHVRMYYLAPLAEVFRRFSTAEGLESFFIHEAKHVAADGTPRRADETVQTGDRYDWVYVHDFSHGGTFERVEPGRLVRFTFGTMSVDQHLQSVLASGPDLRDHDHPQWNDSVSIGFDAGAGPGRSRRSDDRPAR